MPQQKMMKHRVREITKSFGSHVNPEKAEELRRTKTEIESNVTRIVKLIRNEDQSIKDKITKKELVGLIEDFYKQYQSLHALYDNLTGETGSIVRHRRKRSVFSLSASSSDSEYYSSEEVDNNRGKSENELQKAYDHAKQDVETENKFPEVADRKRERVIELEEQLESLKPEVESLHSQHKESEAQLGTKETESKQHSKENVGLQARISVLESMLNEKRDEVCSVVQKLKDNENYSTSKIADLMARASNLELEVNNLRNEKSEMDENIRYSRNESLSQIQGLRDQLDVTQHELDNLQDQKSKWEVQMERKKKEILQNRLKIETLEEKLAEKSAVEQNMEKERECLLANMKESEEQLRAKLNERNRLEEENKRLQARIPELERALIEREEGFSALRSEYEGGKNVTSGEIMALISEVNELRLELESLQERERKLETEIAREREENMRLMSQVSDQRRTMKEREDIINRITTDKNKQGRFLQRNNSKLNIHGLERKMEELAEDFRKKLEDNIRILNQRIHISEQLHSEYKDYYRKTKERHEQESIKLEEKVAMYQGDLRKMRNILETEMSAAQRLEFVTMKLEEHAENFPCRISDATNEILAAKNWVKNKNTEIKQVKRNVESLSALLGDKEEQEFLLREAVWKLEAKVSKEGGEKLNLMQTVSQLEKKMGKLEKDLKEKDEELVNLGEKKREAIRQLCMLNEYHRSRCDQLKDVISKMAVNSRTRA